MIIYHQNNIAAFVGVQKYFNSLQIILTQRITITTAAPGVNIIAIILQHNHLTGRAAI